MVMDDETDPVSSGEGDGMSTGTIIGISIGGIVIFLIALLLISTISNREEGSLAGKYLRTYLDAQVADAVDADLTENPFWEEKQQAKG